MRWLGGLAAVGLITIGCGTQRGTEDAGASAPTAATSVPDVASEHISSTSEDVGNVIEVLEAGGRFTTYLSLINDRSIMERGTFDNTIFVPTDEEVWVELAGEGRIARIDAVTGAVTDHIEVGASGTGQSPAALGRSQPIVGANGLWVLVGDRLHLIDTTSGAVAVTISAPVRDASHVSGAAVTDRGDVWFGDWDRLVTIQTQRGG